VKALVLAGGEGTRLRPFSYSMPKQLIPVANRPVLEYALENITYLGVREIGVIVGEWAPEIERVLGDGSRFGASLTYLPRDRPYGLAQCVMLARDFLGDEDFVMYLADNILPAGVAEFAHEFVTGQPAAQLVVHKVADPTAFGVAELDADGVVLRLEEKPANPRSDLALVGVYFFSPAIHEAVAAIRPSARGELEITDAIQWLIEHGATVRASECGGYWKDTGRIEDVLECNRKLLDGLRPHLAGEVDAASRLTGAVVVEPGARVLRSRIEAPVIIGAGSLIEGGHIGPHTSIGRDCVLRNTRLAYSIVLEGTTVSHVRGLHGSMIGRSATVGNLAHAGSLAAPGMQLRGGSLIRRIVSASTESVPIWESAPAAPGSATPAGGALEPLDVALGHRDALSVRCARTARSPKLRRALAARKAGHAYVVIDGTLIPIHRVAADRPFYSGKHRRHSMNLQVISGGNWPPAG